MTSSIFGAGGVTRLIAGSGVVLSPTTGQGNVTISSSSISGVSSFNTRVGNVVLTVGDIGAALGYTPAPIVSPTFTGSPLAPTQPFGDATNKLATTSFVQFAVTASVAGVSSFNTRSGSVTLTSTDVISALSFTPAAVISPTFTGVPQAPTASVGTNNMQLATTAFVTAAVVSSTTGVSSFNTRTGAVSLTAVDVAKSISSLVATVVTAGSFTAGRTYIIASIGSTNFIAIGAASNTVGLAFFATGAGTGTGTASSDSALALVWNPTFAQADGSYVGQFATNRNSIYINRTARYTGTNQDGVVGAIYCIVDTPTTNYAYEWGNTVWMTSNSNTYTTPYSSFVQYGPQNVGINSTVLQKGTAPVWGFNANVQNNLFNPGSANSFSPIVNTGGQWVLPNAGNVALPTSTVVGQYYAGCSQMANMGALVGNEISLAIAGFDYFRSTVGIDMVAFKANGAPNSYPYAGYRVSDGGDPTSRFQYGVVSNAVSAAYVAGNPSNIGIQSPSGYQVSGTTFVRGFNLESGSSVAVGLDTSLGTVTTNTALRMAAGQGISFEGSDSYKMNYNPTTGFLEFYNGGTRRGYINISSGADGLIAPGGGGGAGVSSFNGATGAVTFGLAQLDAIYGYRAANSAAVASKTVSETWTGQPTFSAGILVGTGAIFSGDLGFNASNTIQWNSSGNIRFGAAVSNAFQLRIKVDGAAYWIQVLNT